MLTKIPGQTDRTDRNSCYMDLLIPRKSPNSEPPLKSTHTRAVHQVVLLSYLCLWPLQIPSCTLRGKVTKPLFSPLTPVALLNLVKCTRSYKAIIINSYMLLGPHIFSHTVFHTAVEDSCQINAFLHHISQNKWINIRIQIIIQFWAV